MSIGGIDIPSEIDGVPVREKAGNSELDRNAFLKLLVTQMSNQDPLNPISNEDFIAQQATFSQLEQQLQLNEKFDKFLTEQKEIFQSMTSVFSSTQSAGYLGKSVEYPSDVIAVSGGQVDPLYLDLGEPSDVSFTVTNTNGNLVRTQDPSSYPSGRGIPLQFDGKDDYGQPLPDGIYQVSLDVQRPDGSPGRVAAFAKRQVSSIDFRTGFPVLRLASGEALTLDEVLSINQ